MASLRVIMRVWVRLAIESGSLREWQEMREHVRILKLAAESQLPERIDTTSSVSVEIVRELMDAGYLSALDASSFSGPAYLDAKITLYGREYLESLKPFDNDPLDETQESDILLFISHSSKDVEFVALVVDLLKSALPLSASQIRCTSLDGYRLRAGANTDQQLKQEVHEAQTFIGVISGHSINSLYVAFELGARWGASLSLIPLIAPGSASNVLTGPLAGINALEAGNRSQLHQLIYDLATELNISVENAAAYENKIDAIVETVFFNNSDADLASEPSTNKPWSPSKAAVEILQCIARYQRKTISAEHIGLSLNGNVIEIEYHLDMLVENKFLHDHIAANQPKEYSLVERRRAYLVENRLM